MPINLKTKCVFIHIPRTGGTTLKQILGMGNIPESGKKKPSEHLTYKEILSFLGENEMRQSFVFSFVRNPWDRILSEYIWRKNETSGMEFKHMSTFDDFVKFVYAKTQGGFKETLLDSHLATQCSYLFDNNRLIKTNFLGKFENFENEAKEIFSYFKIQTNHVPRLDSSFDGRIFVPKTKSLNYKKYYNDETKRTIGKIYQIDIDTLKYTF